MELEKAINLIVRDDSNEEETRLALFGVGGNPEVPFEFTVLLSGRELSEAVWHQSLPEGNLCFTVIPGEEYDCYARKQESNIACERVLVAGDSLSLPLKLDVTMDYDVKNHNFYVNLIAEGGNPESQLSFCCIPKDADPLQTQWFSPSQKANFIRFDVEYGLEYDCYACRLENKEKNIPQSNIAMKRIIFADSKTYSEAYEGKGHSH